MVIKMAAPWHTEQIHVAVGLKQSQLCHPCVLEAGTKGKYLPLKTICLSTILFCWS